MTPLETAGLTLFILVLFSGIFSILFGFPGTILILLASIVYAVLTGFEKVGFVMILILGALSLVAEFLDFYLGIRGVSKFGATKGSIAASLVGAAIGALLLTPVLLGLGTLVGAFVGGAAGTFMVEFARQKDLKPAMRISYALLIGRIFGVFAKGFCALVMIVMILSAIYS